MKITFFELEDWEKEIFEKNLTDHTLDFRDGVLSDGSDLQDAEILSVFIYSKVDKQIIDKMPKLKFIVTRSTGFDHIDVNYCKEKGIKVANVPSYGENTVAEHTFALILALSRKIIPSAERVREGNFNLDDLRGFDLKGKTLGVVGTGHIGKHVVRIANGYEMNIVGWDIKQDEDAIKNYNLKYVDLDDLFQSSDIISLHVPYMEKTHHLINQEALAKFKKGSYLINTSRGGLVDTQALINALDDGTLAGAGLDVLEEECKIKEERQILSKNFPKECLILDIANNILIKNPKVVVTPHNAFNSKEALTRILEATTENISAFADEKPINLI